MADHGRDVPSQTKTVSVVVPCHDYGALLPEALESIERQTREPDEIVLVDDGSADASAAIMASFLTRRPRAKMLSRSPALGAVATFNDGVRASSGELVVILSADDVMSANFLEELEHALLVTGADFAYSSIRFLGSRSGTWPARPFEIRRLARANYVSTSAMFRRQLFDAVGGFDPSFERLGLEDWAFWLAAVARGARGAPVPGCWLGYRRHATGSRNTMTLRRLLDVHLAVRRRWPDVVGRADLVIGIAMDSRAWLRSRLADRTAAHATSTATVPRDPGQP